MPSELHAHCVCAVRAHSAPTPNAGANARAPTHRACAPRACGVLTGVRTLWTTARWTRRSCAATEAAGLSQRTVERARRDLGVKASKRHDPSTGKVVGWQVELPTPPTTPPPSLRGGVGGVGGVVVNRRFPESPSDQSAQSAKEGKREAVERLSLAFTASNGERPAIVEQGEA